MSSILAVREQDYASKQKLWRKTEYANMWIATEKQSTEYDQTILHCNMLSATSHNNLHYI